MDRASSISERLHTLEVLHENGIRTILFMSPMFPELTGYRGIIEASRDYTSEYWFENLNLRGSYKATILSYIEKEYPQYKELYDTIYRKGNKEYWEILALEIKDYCEKNHVNYINYFYHEKLVKEKLARKR